MEKLTLKCGRYIPRSETDATERVRAMEAYLAGLTEELEYLLCEMDKALDELTDALKAAESSE